MENLSYTYPAGMVLSNIKMWSDESLGFLLTDSTSDGNSSPHLQVPMVRSTYCCEIFKLVFTVILVLYIGLCVKGF